MIFMTQTITINTSEILTEAEVLETIKSLEMYKTLQQLEREKFLRGLLISIKNKAIINFKNFILFIKNNSGRTMLRLVPRFLLVKSTIVSLLNNEAFIAKSKSGIKFVFIMVLAKLVYNAYRNISKLLIKQNEGTQNLIVITQDLVKNSIKGVHKTVELQEKCKTQEKIISDLQEQIGLKNDRILSLEYQLNQPSGNNHLLELQLQEEKRLEDCDPDPNKL
uniref:Uncharacterized protein n=1 Tax=Pseudellipsoidion edaphicum TaxID=1431838 RepID=A0A3R5QP58_9STRA|nr:hypothetical protein [Pseudellipsoidion edaphicum]QAA12047.1 hypothetical protein [Pseudellipsoidion edaphicum]